MPRRRRGQDHAGVLPSAVVALAKVDPMTPLYGPLILNPYKPMVTPSSTTFKTGAHSLEPFGTLGSFDILEVQNPAQACRVQALAFLFGGSQARRGVVPYDCRGLNSYQKHGLTWGVFFGGVLIPRALLFGVCLGSLSLETFKYS